MKTLNELNLSGERYLTDKGSIHSYLCFYDKLFGQMRREKINIFEVGYQYGGSCRLWELYFRYADIRAIDIKRWEPTADRETYKLHNRFIEPEGRVRLDIMDIKYLGDEYFRDFEPDIAVDDGSHDLADQIMFVRKVYPHLKKYGYLIVEDIQDWNSAKGEFDKLGLNYNTVDMRDTGVYDNIFIYFTKPDVINDCIDYANRGKTKTV